MTLCKSTDLYLMVQGTDLMKHGRHGKPKVHYFRLAENDTHLTWRSAKGNQRGVVLTMVKQVSFVHAEQQSTASACSFRKLACQFYAQHCSKQAYMMRNVNSRFLCFSGHHQPFLPVRPLLGLPSDGVMVSFMFF